MHLELCLRWARNHAYPGSILPPVAEALSIAEAAGGVKILVRSPLVVAETDTNAWEGYNYKSTVGGVVLICALAVAAVTC